MDNNLKETLPQRCAREIRQNIQNKIYAIHMPSELTLCETLKVSRRTIRAALKLLEKEGLINKAARGTRRTINKNTAKKLSKLPKKKSVAFLSRHCQAEPYASVHDLFGLTHSALEKSGIELIFIHVNISSS